LQKFFEDEYNELKKASRRITGNHALSDELLHWVLDSFMFNPRVDEIISSGGGRFYCVRIMMNQWGNISSDFYKAHRQHSDTIDGLEELPQEDEGLEAHIASKAKQVLSELPWYDRKLFETLVEEGHTVSSLARATGIPRTSVSLTINRIRKQIKRNL
jgi:DNA-directed RNA polymerase specialized sigma24 family protein